jgi:hypothetical protein
VDAKSTTTSSHQTDPAHLGLSPPEEPKPPPAVHEVVRVPVDEEGREMEAPS